MRALTFVVLLTASLVAAQPTPPPDMPLTPDEQAKIVAATADLIEQRYVDEGKGREIAAAIREAIKSDAFHGATSALKLVPPMNRLLMTFGDPHLRFGYDAEPFTGDPDVPETPEEHAQTVRAAAKNGFGIHGVQRLEGNVGLLTIVKWHDPSFAGAAIAAAMELLAPTDALIIDLRASDGGAPEMVACVMSYFFDGDPIQTVTIYNRWRDMTRQFWTYAYVRGPRYVSKDVFILTSKKTWSAAEGFAGAMQSRKRAVVVGEKTRGGRTRAGEWYRPHPNFGIFISKARTIDPLTGKEPEPAYVEPNLEVAAVEAVRTAHLMALRGLREKAKDTETRESLDSSISTLEKQPR